MGFVPAEPWRSFPLTMGWRESDQRKVSRGQNARSQTNPERPRSTRHREPNARGLMGFCHYRIPNSSNRRA